MRLVGGFAAAVVVAVTFGLPLLAAGMVASPSAGTRPGGPPSDLARAEIPPFLLSHYETAPACRRLPWQVVAAIGWVESRHGGGRVNPASGLTSPPIIGIALDGTAGDAAVPATPASTANTGDPVWDHAVGPMQFLTSTFNAWAVDASGGPTPDPENAFDAIATAGRFLCGGSPQLGSIVDAVRRYNNSPAYVADVMAKAIAYGMSLGEGSPTGPGGGDSLGAVTVSADVAPVISFALAQLGRPYVWGATGPDAFDCSGLTQAAYSAAGIRIGRTTYQQALDGVSVDWRTGSVLAGDLVFMASGDGERLGHVGMALDATHWIVAPYTGTVVQIAAIPFDAVEEVRRIVVAAAAR